MTIFLWAGSLMSAPILPRALRTSGLTNQSTRPSSTWTSTAIVNQRAREFCAGVQRCATSALTTETTPNTTTTHLTTLWRSRRPVYMFPPVAAPPSRGELSRKVLRGEHGALDGRGVVERQVARSPATDVHGEGRARRVAALGEPQARQGVTVARLVSGVEEQQRLVAAAGLPDRGQRGRYLGAVPLAHDDHLAGVTGHLAQRRQGSGERLRRRRRRGQQRPQRLEGPLLHAVIGEVAPRPPHETRRRGVAAGRGAVGVALQPGGCAPGPRGGVEPAAPFRVGEALLDLAGEPQRVREELGAERRQVEVEQPAA